MAARRRAATKKVDVDFGDRRMAIEVPRGATVAEFKDPPFLADPEAAVRKALARPHGSPPLAELAKPGMRVAIGFDDPTRPSLPWRTILPVVVEVLRGAGVREEDILFISANGAHRKWRPAEFADHLGPAIFDRFWSRGQIVDHDCADAAGLKDLGVTEHGGYVEHNRRFVEADLMIYVGGVSATYVGGYTGLGAVVGLASARSLASHHSFDVMGHADSATGDHVHQLYRGIKAEINAHIEQATGKRIFYVNSVSGTGGRMAGFFAGYAPAVEAPAWKLADRCSRVRVPQADVLILGLTQVYGYGHSENTLIAAIGTLFPTRIWLGKPVLREGGVVIGMTPSAGRIDAEMFPSYQEVVDLYGRHHDMAGLAEHEAVVAHRPEYLHRYTFGHAYHPHHPFWMLYGCDYGLRRASAVIMAGTRNPGAFRALGMTPARDFDDAWRMATRNVGPDPVTVVAPTFWSRRLFKFDVRS